MSDFASALGMTWMRRTPLALRDRNSCYDPCVLVIIDTAPASRAGEVQVVLRFRDEIAQVRRQPPTQQDRLAVSVQGWG